MTLSLFDFDACFAGNFGPLGSFFSHELFKLCQSRSMKVEAILNLDVGSYNILNVFDQRGGILSKPQGPVNINKATNLIIYAR